MADRTIIERILDSDARWGMMAPLAASTKITVPTSPALTRTETQANCYNDASTCPDDAVPPVNHTSYDVVDTNGRKLRTAYDSGTRTFTTTSPMGRVTKKVLDAQGRVISTVEPGDSTTSNTATNYTYVNGQLTTVARGARQATFGYWPGTSGGMSGYQQTSTDFDGTTTTAVDAMGRATTITQSTALTSLTWSPSGRLEAISPPGRPGHDPQYNQVGLMTKYVPPTLTGIDTTFNWDYSRDRDLELARLAGTSIDYIYDSAKGRLTELRFPEDTITYGYYGNAVCAGCAPGRLQTAVAASSGNTTTFEYAGQLQTKVTQARSQSPTWSVATSWTYDSNFWPISEKVEKAGGTSTTVTYGFDDDGVVKCASVGTCAETTKTFTITPWPKSARPNTLKLDTVSEARAFNTFGELKSQTLTRVAVPTALISLEYEQTGFPRDGLGRVSDLKETVGATPKTTHYEYDEFGRLFEVIVNGSEVVGHYEYDANGNRGNGTIWKNKAGQLVQGTFQYDAQDRLLSFASSTPGVPSVTYEYTPKGDLKRAYGTSFDYRYIYDARGGLRSATTAGGIIDYLLDASGRRVGRRKNGTLERQWVYAKSGSAIAELDGSGNIVSRFVYATGRNVPDFMVTVTDGVIYRIFSDQLGSVRMVVNAATGAIKQELDYDAFGNVLTDTLPQFQPFGFAGGIYDVDTGFVRFGARDYDPSVGRWVSKDPILFDGEQANLYVYVNNDPLNHRDPSGTDESDPSFFDLAYVGGRVLLCHYLGIACPEPDAGPDRGFTGGGALPSGARPAMPEVCTEPKKEKDSCAQACVPYLGRNARYIGTDGHVYRNDLGGLWAFNRCVAECRGKTIN